MNVRTFSLRHVLTALALTGALSAHHASANITWAWHYEGSGVNAQGTLSTADTPDADGFYQITAIDGNRNGDAITGLYPTGQAIPNNEPYVLDNLIRVDSNNQLTMHGFGFTTASGGYVNPFYADYMDTPVYLEAITIPGRIDERPITFSATAVPEPEVFALALSGLAVVAWAARKRR